MSDSPSAARTTNSTASRKPSTGCSTASPVTSRVRQRVQRPRGPRIAATPLAAIQSSVEVTLLVDRTVEEYKEELLDLLEEFDRLRLLVNQLLLLAEGDAGRLGQGREPVRLDELVRRAIEMFQAVAESESCRRRRSSTRPMPHCSRSSSSQRPTHV